MKYARCALLGFAVTMGITGCATVDKKSDAYQKWSDYLECKARKLRNKEAERKAAQQEREQAQAACQCEPQRAAGTMQETAETEVRFLLENDISLVDYNLDFEAIGRMAQQQAKLDEEYKKARKAWEDYETERRRRHGLHEQARARAEAEAPAAGEQSGCGCVRVTPPSCAYPPPQEYVKTPPPKRQAVGLEEIPIVIRANARFDVGEFGLRRSRVRQDYQPGKQPCCPRCGVSGCRDHCDACGYTPNPAAPPPAPAVEEADDYPSAQYLPENGLPENGQDDFSSAGLFSLNAAE